MRNIRDAVIGQHRVDLISSISDGLIEFIEQRQIIFSNAHRNVVSQCEIEGCRIESYRRNFQGNRLPGREISGSWPPRNRNVDIAFGYSLNNRGQWFLFGIIVLHEITSDILDDAVARRRFLLLLDGHDEKEEQIVYPDILARLGRDADRLAMEAMRMDLP